MTKTLTFAAMHITIAFVIVYLMTGDVVVGGAVALVEPICNSIGYFFHERLWERWRSTGSLVQHAARGVLAADAAIVSAKSSSSS